MDTGDLLCADVRRLGLYTYLSLQGDAGILRAGKIQDLCKILYHLSVSLYRKHFLTGSIFPDLCGFPID